MRSTVAKFTGQVTSRRHFGAVTSFGAGGRSSNSGLTATVFGGYGFVGRYLLSELGMCGTRVYAPFRGDELEVRHLKPMFDLGQLGLIPFSVRDKDSVRESLKNSDIVINLIGKHYETKHAVPTRRADGKLCRVNYSFEDIHVEAAATIAQLAKEAGVKSFVHVSALAADKDSASKWSRTKALGEEAVRKHFPEAVIVKLATVFGPEDRFLNWIAEATNLMPIFPLLNGGGNLIQPVYVGDVAKGLLEITQDVEKYEGKTLQFVGPSEYSYKEVAEFVQDVTLTRKPLIDIPNSTANFVGKITEQFISPVLSPDMIAQMQEDVVQKHSGDMQTLSDIGVELTNMDRLAFDYLHRFRKGGHFVLAKGYH